MNKPRKYNGVYKLPIKKHTKIRRPMSMYIIYTSGENLCFDPAGSAFPLVQDISKGLENPLILLPGMNDNWKKAMKAQDTINQIYNEMQTMPPITLKGNSPKPSLLTRVKERFKR